jgi:chemotaxis protein methyltransferase CheR
MRTPPDSLELMEIALLLESIYRHYGYDFRDYAPTSIRRRIWHRIGAERLHSVSGLQEKVLHDPSAMDRLFTDFSINVTEMFRDPSFFAALRHKVIPWLRTVPHVRIWHAGCSTGEEVYAMAILLHEEGLYRKARIYGTDMNGAVLSQAAQARFPLQKMQAYTRNYLQSGGQKAFSEYYAVQGGEAVFHPFLAENLVFSQHNLVTDHSFNEFHLILCRNVLIYFNESMQKRVLQLFNASLVASGFLGLGRKEGIRREGRETVFEAVDPQERIYRKMTRAAKEGSRQWSTR